MSLGVVDFTPMHTAHGPGMAHTWLCMGCRKPKFTRGSRGKGTAKRCAECVAQREARRAAESPVAKLARLVAEAGAAGVSSRVLADRLRVPATDVRRLRREAKAQGHAIYTHREGVGKGGGLLLHFASQSDADAYGKALEARHFPPRPRGQNASSRRRLQPQPAADIQAAALAIAQPRKDMP
jgi:hypothetical protein